MSQTFDFENLVELCRQTHEETQRSTVHAVDRSLVVRNWLFGWYIVEYEQHGADRAEYGAQTLRTLSSVLKARIGRGFSVDALERMRRFYLLYGHILSENPVQEKSATLLRISGGQADLAGRSQHLRIKIPTLSALETRTCSPTGEHPERVELSGKRRR